MSFSFFLRWLPRDLHLNAYTELEKELQSLELIQTLQYSSICHCTVPRIHIDSASERILFVWDIYKELRASA